MIGFGTHIVEDSNCYTTREDWSRVRSPGRAKRRRKLGHPQNIRIVHEPAAYQIMGVIHAHPAIYAAVCRKFSDRTAKEG